MSPDYQQPGLLITSMAKLTKTALYFEFKYLNSCYLILLVQTWLGAHYFQTFRLFLETRAYPQRPSRHKTFFFKLYLVNLIYPNTTTIMSTPCPTVSIHSFKDVLKVYLNSTKSTVADKVTEAILSWSAIFYFWKCITFFKNKLWTLVNTLSISERSSSNK